MPVSVTIYTKNDFDGIKVAGRLAAQALDYVCSFVKAGITTQFLDDNFNDFLAKNNANAACLGYCGYPKSLCVSLNNEICHGIPSEKVIKDGDVVSVDLVVEKNGYYGDTCKTVIVGKVSQRVELLVDITEKAMMKAINDIKPGMLTKDIGKIIQDFVAPYGLGIVKQYCGHGIGKKLHEPPQILHYYNSSEPDIKIREGMCFTIEPMICLGSGESKQLADGWTVVTKDKSICAQFEHTIFMTKNGSEICTIF